MSGAVDDFTADEISAAYRKARLRYIGVSLMKAINTPMLYRSLCGMARAARKTNQQDGQPAPLQRAA